jgi:cytochrome c peroxidase
MLIKAVTLFFIALSQCFAQGVLPEKAPEPKDNPTTEAKVELGKALYFDPRLSIDGTISCNSCHNVMSAGDDARPVSVGVKGQKGGRGAPTVWNSAFNSVQFWDGRAKDLETQAVGPLTNPIEMGMPSHDAVMKRIKKIPGYISLFDKAFGKNKITIENLGKAIAAFERTLITPNSPYDRFVKGDKKALSPLAQKGLKLVEEVGCTACHSGPHFSGEEAMGVGNFQPFPQIPGSKFDKMYDLLSDMGRFEETKKDDDKHMWRVPTWRNIALTAPYFHNGKVQTLEEAVIVMAKTQLDLDLKPNQVKEIVAFLESLTGEFPKIDMPRLPQYPKTTFTPDP